jgi:hypothetical protein
VKIVPPSLAEQDAKALLVVVLGGIVLMALLVHLNQARTVRLQGDSVVFASRKMMSVPVSDITEIRRRRADFNRMGPVFFVTSTHGTVRASPRLRGLIELVVEIRRANPGIKLGDL